MENLLIGLLIGFIFGFFYQKIRWSKIKNGVLIFDDDHYGKKLHNERVLNK